MSRSVSTLKVTTSSEGQDFRKTRIWDLKRPLRIGSPVQATLEHDQGNIVISGNDGDPHVISKKAIQASSPIEIRLRNHINLVVQVPDRLSAPLENVEEIYENVDSSSFLKLSVSKKIRNFNLGFESIDSSYVGYANDVRIFSLQKKGKDYVLKSHQDQLIVHLQQKKPAGLKSKKTFKIAAGEISLMNLTWDQYGWEFAWLSPPAPYAMPGLSGEGSFVEDVELGSSYFNVGLGIVFSLYTAIATWVWLAPKHELTPIGIPPEKIVATTEIKIEPEPVKVLEDSKEKQPNSNLVLPNRFFESYKASLPANSVQVPVAVAPAVVPTPVEEPAPVVQPKVYTQPKAVVGFSDAPSKQNSQQNQASRTFALPSPQKKGGTLSQKEKSAIALKQNSKALQEALGDVVAMMKSQKTDEKKSPPTISAAKLSNQVKQVQMAKMFDSPAVKEVAVKKVEIQHKANSADLLAKEAITTPRQYVNNEEVHREVARTVALNKKVTYTLDEAAINSAVSKSGNSVGLSSAGLSRQEVVAVIRSHLSEVRYCYEAASRIRPIPDGKVVLKFTVMGSGQVKQAQIEETTIREPRLESCLVGQVKAWVFTKTKGGSLVEVSYPFVFHSLVSGG